MRTLLLRLVNRFCLCITCILSGTLLHAQQTISIRHSYTIKDVLAERNVIIPDSIFRIRISILNNGYYLFEAENASYYAESMRTTYANLLDSLSANKGTIKQLSDSLQSIIEKLETLRKSRDTATAQLLKDTNEVNLKLVQLRKDTSNTRLAIAKLDSVNCIKKYFFSSPNLSLSLLSHQAEEFLYKIISWDSIKINNYRFYIEQELGALILSAQTGTIKDENQVAGTLCLNKEIPIYSIRPQYYGKIKTSVFQKRVTKVNRINRALKCCKINCNHFDPIIERIYNYIPPFVKVAKRYLTMYDLIEKSKNMGISIDFLLNTLSNCDTTCFGEFCNMNKIIGFLNLEQQVIPIDTFLSDSVHIEIRESSIYNIALYGHFKSNISSYLVFDNRNIPYPISSQIYLKNYRKYIPLQSRLFIKGVAQTIPSPVVYEMNLWDAIHFSPVFPKGGDNISPGDTVFSIKQEKGGTGCIELNRTKFQNLFEVKVFTDPLGFASDVPNGLIQMEINKRFTTVSRSTKVNGFTFVEPKFVWSKIENKGNLAYQRTDTIKELDLTSIDLYKYSKLNLDFRVNGVTFALPAASMIMYLNAGCGVFQTRMSDTIFKEDKVFVNDTVTTQVRNIRSIKNTNINTLNYYLDLEMKFRPDNRYNLILNTRLGRLVTLNKEYVFKDDVVVGRQPFNYYSVSIEASAMYNGIRNFFRGTFVSSITDAKNNCFQIQVGVAKTLFKAK